MLNEQEMQEIDELIEQGYNSYPTEEEATKEKTCKCANCTCKSKDSTEII